MHCRVQETARLFALKSVLSENSFHRTLQSQLRGREFTMNKIIYVHEMSVILCFANVLCKFHSAGNFSILLPQMNRSCLLNGQGVGSQIKSVGSNQLGICVVYVHGQDTLLFTYSSSVHQESNQIPANCQGYRHTLLGDNPWRTSSPSRGGE